MPFEPKKLTLKGTPREIGHQHGHTLPRQIKSNITLYAAMFRHTSSLPWSDVRCVAEQFRSTIEHLTPAVYEEMLGIAEGVAAAAAPAADDAGSGSGSGSETGVNVLDIVALNCRSEIALGRFGDGCSSFSWKKSQGDGEGRVLAQNWDWVGGALENLVMVHIQMDNGRPGIYMVTEAGIIGKIGLNTAGLGTCLNAIRAKPTNPTKLPIHVALRLCLESTSVENAVHSLTSLGGVASSQHILIADPSTSLGLELSPLGDVYLREDDFGMVVHTNHFLENGYVYEPPWLSGSPVRLERVRELARGLLKSENGVLPGAPLAGLLREKVFSDTYNAPQSICCYEDPAQHYAVRCKTLFNIVMNLDSRDLSAEVVWGQPGSGNESAVFKMPWS